jgi:phosphoribosylformylglycinamidine synthase
MDDIKLFKSALETVQEMINEDLILAGHDVSDGGLVVTLMEMAFAGNCGIDVHLDVKRGVFERMFSEELGLVIEINPEHSKQVIGKFKDKSIPIDIIGSSQTNKEMNFRCNNGSNFNLSMEKVRSWWEETSYQIERLQMNPDCADEEKKNNFSRRNPTYKTSFNPALPFEVAEEDRNQYPVAILREEGSNGDREMTSAFYMAGFRPYDVNMKDLLDGRITLEQFRGVVAVGGFSYADYPDSAKGWASVIRENSKIWEQFKSFYKRPDTFSLGVCNGCQLFALLGWVPWYGLSDERQPRFIQNISKRFESRWASVKIFKSPAIMLKGMEESVLGIWVAHGEGRLHFPDLTIMDDVLTRSLAPIAFVDDNGYSDSPIPENSYPFNMNGSPYGITGLCSPDGRHLAMMPHPERAFLKWQWPYLPEELDKQWLASPWLKMFQNAREWCEVNKLKI